MSSIQKKEKTDFILISPETDALEERCLNICKEFSYSFRREVSVDALADEGDHPEGRLIVVSTLIGHDKNSAAGLIQVAKHFFPDSFIVCLVGKRINKEAAAFVKKSGANLIILEDEIYNTSKLEFVCTQVIKASFIPIKVSDLDTQFPISFGIYHFMPMRQKFLKCAFPGDTLDEAKMQKLSSVGEFYVKREEVDEFKNYINLITEGSQASLEKRCRVQYLSLKKNYADLVFLLTDQSEFGDYEKGKNMLNTCQELSKEILISLGSLGSAWGVVNNTKMGDFGSIERATAVAAYAGLAALQMGMKKVDEIMVCALLADIGLVFIPPNISKKIRDDLVDQLTPEERAVYETYPFQSLQIALDRKLPMESQIRDIIVSTHEAVDGTGFPKKLLGNKVSVEAQLIHFCNILDNATMIKMGEKRKDFDVVRSELILNLDQGSKFSIKLMELLKAHFVKGNLKVG